MHMYHNRYKSYPLQGKHSRNWGAVGTQIGASPNGGNISIANTFLVLITLALVVTMILIQCMPVPSDTSHFDYITLIRPILFSFIQSEKVKMLVVDLLSKMAESTDNTVDDQMVEFIRNGLFPAK